MQRQVFSTAFGSKTLTAEFTDLTTFAHGSVLLKYGETTVLVTAVMGRENASLAYFPLSVDFEEKFYAAGEILGSRFMRREGRPSDEAILSARIVDRTIRPLFPSGLKSEVQVVVTVLAVGEDDPDVLGVIGASLALGVSPIPWAGPVGAVRLLKTANGRIILNPTYAERETNQCLEVMTCGKDGLINMIETAAKEVTEPEVVELLTAATLIHTEINKFQADIISQIGVPKVALSTLSISELLIALFANQFADRLYQTIFSGRPGKNHIYDLKNDWLKAVKVADPDVTSKVAEQYFEEQVDTTIHKGAVIDGKRADGRSFEAVRALYAQAGDISPVLHGSGIFYRGDTHIFSALTLGGPEAAQLIDTMEERSTKKRFMHHYNFPPFSVGEAGRVGGFNRRMIGHGALAEKALAPVIPDISQFPYTIRLVSETLASNGSSSMGSVCASTLALLDGGVPLLRPVAGIASGVMLYEGKYKLLTDIQGPEDEYGDMDFKVAGTSVGITAIQMDVKVTGIKVEILAEALSAAKVARLHILATMEKALSTHRPQISPRAPEIVSLQILPEQIGLVIGGGGKTINSIKDQTGVEEISIEDDGTMFITGKNGTAALAATTIKQITRRYTVGEPVLVTITKIAAFGAFAKLDNYHEGLIHISEIGPERLNDLVGILTVGEMVEVVVIKVDAGKIGLSIKQRQPEFLSQRRKSS